MGQVLLEHFTRQNSSMKVWRATAFMCVWMCGCVRGDMCGCVCGYMYIYIYTYVCVCVCVCVCGYACVCLFVHMSPCRKRGEAKGDRQKSDRKGEKKRHNGYQKVTETEKSDLPPFAARLCTCVCVTVEQK